MAIKLGDKAPEFKLHNTDKKIVSLTDYKDKNVVLLFFPFAFSSPCTDELCQVKDEYKSFESLDAQVIGISVDSPFTLAKFKDEQSYSFPLLSDFNKELCGKYGCKYEEFAMGLKGVAKRSAFVIDKEGIIRYAEVLDNAGDIPNFAAVKETLESI